MSEQYVNYCEYGATLVHLLALGFLVAWNDQQMLSNQHLFSRFVKCQETTFLLLVATKTQPFSEIFHPRMFAKRRFDKQRLFVFALHISSSANSTVFAPESCVTADVSTTFLHRYLT